MARKCGLNGGIEQRTNLVLIRVLERKGATIEHTYDRERKDKI